LNEVAMQDFTPQEVAQLRRMLARMQAKFIAYAAATGPSSRSADADSLRSPAGRRI
jgi:hypothetical protein